MLYRHMIEERTQIFLGKLLATPKDIRNHIELSVLHFVLALQSLTALQSSGRTCHVPYIRV